MTMTDDDTLEARRLLSSAGYDPDAPTRENRERVVSDHGASKTGLRLLDALDVLEPTND